jgi:uncharacterized protein YndB with AHSA1/START domain
MTTPPAPLPTPAGEVALDGDFGELRFVRTLAHPPEAVWAALTDPAQLRKWFMTKATIDGRPGGSVDMVSGPASFHWTGRILTWDPPRVYEYEWNADPRPELPRGEKTVVRWELAPTSGGTKLTLTHRRITKPTALGFAPGTHAFLDRLAAQLAGESLPDWMGRYDAVKHAYPAWSPQG